MVDTHRHFRETFHLYHQGSGDDGGGDGGDDDDDDDERNMFLRKVDRNLVHYMTPYLRRLLFNLQSTSNITTSFRKMSAKQHKRPS